MCRKEYLVVFAIRLIPPAALKSQQLPGASNQEQPAARPSAQAPSGAHQPPAGAKQPPTVAINPNQNLAAAAWALLTSGAGSEKARDRSDALSALTVLNSDRQAVSILAGAPANEGHDGERQGQAGALCRRRCDSLAQQRTHSWIRADFAYAVVGPNCNAGNFGELWRKSQARSFPGVARMRSLSSCLPRSAINRLLARPERRIWPGLVSDVSLADEIEVNGDSWFENGSRH